MPFQNPQTPHSPTAGHQLHRYRIKKSIHDIFKGKGYGTLFCQAPTMCQTLVAICAYWSEYEVSGAILRKEKVIAPLSKTQMV